MTDAEKEIKFQREKAYSQGFLDGYEACLRDEKEYEWHDLRKDSNDLPTANGFYIACVEHPKNHTRTTREIRFCGFNLHNGEPLKEPLWDRNNRFLLKDSVIAWKCIEPFKEV